MEQNIKDNENLSFIQRVKKWDYKRTLKNGLISGFKTTWVLAKIMIPVYFFVTLLGHTPVLEWISGLLAPVMKVVGLPGEAALALVLGNVINIYAAIGVIAGLTLTAKEITIIAVMLSFSHSLFPETAVAKKTGISAFAVIMIRFTLAILSGIVLNLVI